jgi:hypothetical protein
MGHEASDRDLPIGECDIGLLSQIEDRKRLDDVLPWRQSIISLIKHFALFSASPGFCPLFLGSRQSAGFVHQRPPFYRVGLEGVL